MPSSRVVSREQALKNKFERQLKVAEAGRKTARGRQAALSETVDFFVGGAARGIGNLLGNAKDRAQKDMKNFEQFTSAAAKNVIKDVQGRSKMTMKGFGN
jgi:hypothetical protein